MLYRCLGLTIMAALIAQKIFNFSSKSHKFLLGMTVQHDFNIFYKPTLLQRVHGQQPLV